MFWKILKDQIEDLIKIWYKTNRKTIWIGVILKHITTKQQWRKKSTHLTLNEWRKGFRSFISLASDNRPSPFPSEAGSTSKTMISRGCVSKGSASNAKNPGFSTAHTCTYKDRKVLIESSTKYNKSYQKRIEQHQDKWSILTNFKSRILYLLPIVITATKTVRQTTLSGIIILLDFG